MSWDMHTIDKQLNQTSTNESEGNQKKAIFESFMYFQQCVHKEMNSDMHRMDKRLNQARTNESERNHQNQNL